MEQQQLFHLGPFVQFLASNESPYTAIEIIMNARRVCKKWRTDIDKHFSYLSLQFKIMCLLIFAEKMSYEEFPKKLLSHTFSPLYGWKSIFVKRFKERIIELMEHIPVHSIPIESFPSDELVPIVNTYLNNQKKKDCTCINCDLIIVNIIEQRLSPVQQRNIRCKNNSKLSKYLPSNIIERLNNNQKITTRAIQWIRQLISLN